jgi:hypothetical protein
LFKDVIGAHALLPKNTFVCSNTMLLSMKKRLHHEDMVASLFAASIQEDDGIEASLLQTFAATLAVLERAMTRKKNNGGGFSTSRKGSK